MEGPQTSLDASRDASASPLRRRAAAWLHAFECGCLAYRRFVLFLIALCLVLVGAWWVVRKQLGPIVRPWIERQARQMLEGRDLEPLIGSAEFVEGQGIWLRNVSLNSTCCEGPALVHVDELLIRSDQSLWQIAQNGFQPQRILIRHLRANLTPEADGSYAAERLFPLPTAGGQRVPVSIVDAAVSLGGDLGGWQFEEHISNLRIDVVPPADSIETDSDGTPLPQIFQISADLQATRVGKLSIEGEFDATNRRWHLRGKAQNLRLSTELVRASERLSGSDLSDLVRLDAGVDLEFRVSGEGTNQPVAYWASGELRDGRVDDARLPDPIVDMRGRFEASNERWTFHEISARAGQGVLQMNAARTATAAGDHWTADLAIDSVHVDQRLEKYIPDSLRKYWLEFRPSGLMDGRVHLEGIAGSWQPSVDLTLHDASFVYALFPYPVHHCRGSLHWSRERMSFDIEGKASGSRVIAKGEYQNPGVNSSGRLDIRLVDLLPISEELMEALSVHPSVEQTVRQFNPKGQLGVEITIQRPEPGGPFHRTYIIDLYDGSLRYTGLPYNLHGVTGRIVVDDGWMHFREIRGHNGSGLVTCSGKLGPDRLLDLSFASSSLSLDDELRRALPEALRDTWDRMKPQGHLDHLVATYRRNLETSETNLRIEARMWDRRSEERTGVSIRPAWMPFTWHELTGSIIYDNGQLTINDLRGHHQDTTIAVQGIGHTSADGWWIDLSPCSIDRIEPTAELLESLPPVVKQGLRTIDLAGRLSLHGRITVMSGQRDPAFTPPLIRRDSQIDLATQEARALEVQWDQIVDLEQAGITIAGQRLHNAHGSLSTVGVMVGDRMESFGHLELDTVMWRDSQLRDVRGPLFLDATRIAFGSLAPRPGEDSIPRPLSGSWIGGRVQLDGQMMFDRDMPFMVQGSITEGRLELARDEFGWDVDDLSGAIYAGIRLEGSGTDPNLLAGRGTIQLRDAAIYELPLMVNMLKLLSIRQVDRTAFTTSNIDYQVRRDRIDLQRVDLSGDAISLQGSGEIDMGGRLQAQFYTRVGRQDWELPILSPIVGAASRQFLLIQIDGTLNDPQVTQIPFPKINDALQAMTAEPGQGESLGWPDPTSSTNPIPLGFDAGAWAAPVPSAGGLQPDSAAPSNRTNAAPWR